MALNQPLLCAWCAEPSTRLHPCLQGSHRFSSRGPQYLTPTCPPDHPQGTMVTQSQSPHHLHLGFFSSRPGGNQRNGWAHCLLPLRTTFVTKCLSLGSQETGPCWYMGQQLRSTSCHETSSGMSALADWGQNTLVRQGRSLLYPAHVLPHQPLERNL